MLRHWTHYKFQAALNTTHVPSRSPRKELERVKMRHMGHQIPRHSFTRRSMASFKEDEFAVPLPSVWARLLKKIVSMGG